MTHRPLHPHFLSSQAGRANYCRGSGVESGQVGPGRAQGLVAQWWLEPCFPQLTVYIDSQFLSVTH